MRARHVLGSLFLVVAALLAFCQTYLFFTLPPEFARLYAVRLSLLSFGFALPGNGPMFPYLRTVRAGDRATEFKQRCDGLGIKGVSLHSYRYAWAERAKSAGYPERYAQVNLGHNSKAMTRAYSRKAEVEMPSLSEYERMRTKFAEMSKTIEPVMASA